MARRANPLSKTIHCSGNKDRTKSVVKVSVRAERVSLFVTGNQWPHLDFEQAFTLMMWLHDAIDEIAERRDAGRPFYRCEATT